MNVYKKCGGETNIIISFQGDFGASGSPGSEVVYLWDSLPTANISAQPYICVVQPNISNRLAHIPH